jgi:hypothetical protein
MDMLNTMDLGEMIKLLAPILVLQLILQIYCVINIARNGVGNLNKVIWIFIVVCFNTLGSIVYLMVGRKKY